MLVTSLASVGGGLCLPQCPARVLAMTPGARNWNTGPVLLQSQPWDCLILVFTLTLPSWPGFSPSPQLPSCPRFMSDPNSSLTGPDQDHSTGLNLPCPRQVLCALAGAALGSPAPCNCSDPISPVSKISVYVYLLCQKLRTYFWE